MNQLLRETLVTLGVSGAVGTDNFLLKKIYEALTGSGYSGGGNNNFIWRKIWTFLRGGAVPSGNEPFLVKGIAIELGSDGQGDFYQDLYYISQNIEAEDPVPLPDPIEDAFGRPDGAIGSDWTNAAASHTIVSGRARSVAQSFEKNLSIYTKTATQTANQYCMIRYINNGDTGPFVGLAFRYSDALSGHYLIDWNAGSLYWSYYANAASAGQRNIINGGGGSYSFTTNTLISLTCIGEGAATRLRVWRAPSGAKPDAGGTTWGGVAPYINQLIDAGPTADNGRYLGICTFQQAQNAVIDDFSGGDVPT